MVSKIVEIAITIIVSLILVVSISLIIYWKVANEAAAKGPGYTDIVHAIPLMAGGLVLGRKKGIELTVNLVATIVLLLVGALLVFLIFAGIAAESGSSTGNFFYSMFDAIIRSIPLVG